MTEEEWIIGDDMMASLGGANFAPPVASIQTEEEEDWLLGDDMSVSLSEAHRIPPLASLEIQDYEAMYGTPTYDGYLRDLDTAAKDLIAARACCHEQGKYDPGAMLKVPLQLLPTSWASDLGPRSTFALAMVVQYCGGEVVVCPPSGRGELAKLLIGGPHFGVSAMQNLPEQMNGPWVHRRADEEEWHPTEVVAHSLLSALYYRCRRTYSGLLFTISIMGIEPTGEFCIDVLSLKMRNSHSGTTYELQVQE